MYSVRFDKALTLAGLRHAGQVRKGTGAPYLVHLVHVAAILARAGHDEDTQITGLLHDVLEDTVSSSDERNVVAADIRQMFGSEVADAVETLTEPKRTSDGARLPWRSRKDRYLAQLSVGSPMALRVSAADKLHNLASLEEELAHEGEAVWQRFRVGPDETYWFYRSVFQIIVTRAPNEALPAALGEQLRKMNVID